MMWLSRFASPAVQRAHARVTAENARYVREALDADITIDRLTDERDRARAAVTELQAKYLRVLEAWERLNEDNDRLSRELAEVNVELLACRTGLCEWSSDLRGQLNAAKAELARADRRWFGHIASCDVALALHDVDRDKARENSE